MNPLLKYKNQLAEQMNAKYQSPKTMVAYALSSFLVASVENNMQLCEKACFLLQAQRKKDFTNLNLYFLSLFLHVQLHHGEESDMLLHGLKPYKNSLRNTEPLFYGYCLYFEALREFQNDKQNKAQKIFKQLQAQNIEKPLPKLHVAIASLALHFSLFDVACIHLEMAYQKGDRSVFLFLATWEYFRQSQLPLQEGSPLMVAFLRFALQKGIQLTYLLHHFQDLLKEQLKGDTYHSLCKELYNLYPSNWLLDNICRHFIRKNDFSLQAFYYYKEAETKQLFFSDLNDFLIQSAKRNKIEDLSHFTLLQFLQNKEIDVNMKPFVYHLMLTNEKFSDLIAQNRNEMLAFACDCLQKRLTGIYFFTLYKFVLDNPKEAQCIEENAVSLAENMIKYVLFSYEVTVTNENVKHLWVLEKETKETKVYPVSNKKAMITAVSKDCTIICFGEDLHTILHVNTTLLPLVNNADFSLYKRFFDSQFTPPELLIVLSKQIIAQQNEEKADVNVLEKTLASPFVSTLFKMQISAFLGHVFATKQQFETAVAYYEQVDENCLNNKQIEQMLLTYAKAKEFGKAANLIAKRSECLTDRDLFFALKQIAMQPAFSKTIVDAAYELILKNWYDKTLIDLVLQNYQGSQAEWQELSCALSRMSISDQNLDEIILNNAIFIHHIDENTEEIFVRMFRLMPENPLIQDFSGYLVYEMLLNNFKPQYETLEVLQALCLKQKEHFLAYALTHVYLQHNLTTTSSNEIIQMALAFAQEDEIIFPVFKSIKDKQHLTSYIEKNQTFMYRSFPNKTVLLHFKTSTEDEYRKIPMHYARFGFYFAAVPLFFGETITYYFSELKSSGSSLETKEVSFTNNKMHLLDNPQDAYYQINNALIFEQMFKYEQVEEMIQNRLAKLPRTKTWLL